MFEGSEKDIFMVEFVKRSFLIDYMKLENVENIEIMRVYCMLMVIRRDVLKLCFIYVYFLKYIDR